MTSHQMGPYSRPVARIVKTKRQAGLAPPSPPLPSLPPLSLEVGPLNPARVSGEHCKLPQRVWDGAPAEVEFGVF